MTNVVVVGAGPAGVRATQVLVKNGIRPVVIDESPMSGGQIYRQQPGNFKRPIKKLYGFEAVRAEDVHQTFAELQDHIDYRPETAVWDVCENTLHVVTNTDLSVLTWDRLIIASGAMDRVIPFPGWTLPGVYTLGGSQVALKYQACAIGERPVFVGTGPLLYLVSYQYAAAGVAVAGVFDTAPLAAQLSALPGLITGGSTFWKGIYYIAQLHLRGIPVKSAIRPISVCPDDAGSVSAFFYQDSNGRKQQIKCDAVATGFGLKSETQLADLCELEFSFDAMQRQWLPAQDVDGRTSVEGIYSAGDGAGINGAVAAELSGARAAYALLSDLGHSASTEPIKRLNKALSRFHLFRKALDTKAFVFPKALAHSAQDDLVICRCEGITAGELRCAAKSLGATDINRAKAFTRMGMGRCQGRVCAAAASEILAHALDVELDKVGRLRGQAPIKPIPMTAFLEGEK